MVLSLYDIALAKCLQLSARITDVGDIPYPLIKPVLRRFNAKQLCQVELNSPLLTPESDELWAQLIERDFPDRPQLKRNLKLDGNDGEMPNKLLYKRYCDERELLRASSAQRLRKMTQKLQKEKLKNSIVPIQGIIREPVIRRHTSMGSLPQVYLKYGKKSIMGKAMKDMQHRQLMFGKPQRKDPYEVFHNRKREVRVPAGPRLPGFQKDGMGIYSQKPVVEKGERSNAKSGEKTGSDSPKQKESHTQERNQAQGGVISPVKRKSTSIFLSSKRMCKAPRIPPERERKREIQRVIAPPSTVKAVRSSLFH